METKGCYMQSYANPNSLQSEEALQESEERFRQLFSQNDDAIMLFDFMNREVIDMNEAARKLFGVTLNEMQGRDICLLVNPDDRRHFSELISGLNQERGLQADGLRIVRSDSFLVSTSIRGKLIHIQHRKVVYCSFRDITDKIRLEQEAKIAQTRLIQADKMASLGLLVSGIAHEINNPNNYIMFNSELLAKAWQSAMPILDEYYRENGDFKLGDFRFSETRDIVPRLFSGLQEGSERIRNIVDKLKNFARQDTGSTRERVDVNQVILDAIAILNHEIKSRCDNFSLAAGRNIPAAQGCAQQIEQVVINLIMNALQSLPDRKKGIRIITAQSGNGRQIVITVEDEGRGMSAEVQKHLVEPFYTTRSDSGGTGLGLSISESILRDNQGTISFASEPGRGTTATVLLQVHPAENDRVE